MAHPGRQSLCSSLSLCSSSTLPARSRRAFSSLPARRAIGPESPRYVEVRQPPQQTAPQKPRIKGVLPTPRNIFPNGDSAARAAPEYLAAVTPEPGKKARASRPGSEAERLAWKARMAAVRRRNLREGLTELHIRKTQAEQRSRARSERSKAEREALLSQPEREDERLTRPSVTQDILQALNKQYKGRWAAQTALDFATARHIAKQQQKSTARTDALHELYMQARSFITTDAQLNAAVDEAFGTDDDNQKKFDVTGNSVWAWGPPPSTTDMLNKDRNEKARGASLSTGVGEGKTVARRIKRIAEELTGGKI